MALEFHADRPALDFVATIAERGTTDDEKLLRPEDLGAWAVASGLLAEQPPVTARQLASAVALREALYRVLTAAIDDAMPAAQDLDLVNAAARRRRPIPELSATWQVTRAGAIDGVLAELASDGIELLGSGDRKLLRRCADPRCTRLFVDRSRGRRRRWCDMKGCGDRAKAAAYRRRHRRAEPTSAR